MSSANSNKPLFALVDCNNFYVSCERVFDPRLWNKPVVILSNNDGCVIARSNEAKAVGIPMGAPAFQYRDLFRVHGIVVYSSNFPLYGDMSQRVMNVLAYFTPDMEIYSIDEAFLRVEEPSLEGYAKQIKEKVYKWTGIPISIGIAPTKTLAKLANRYAKKNRLQEGYFLLIDADVQKKILAECDVEDIWGIGRKISAFLKKNDIYTALELAEADDVWIKKNLSVVVLRTVWELRGISCLTLEEVVEPKKSIASTRTFGNEIETEEDLSEAIAGFVSIASEKLREQESVASFLEVFIQTNRFKEGEIYGNSMQIKLPEGTDYTPTLIHHAKNGLHQIFREGFKYKRAGILLSDLTTKQCWQKDLFSPQKTSVDKQDKIMQLMDEINGHYGKDTLKLAAQGINPLWKSKKNHITSSFTTSWEGLLTIHMDQIYSKRKKIRT